jgi:hypothetical protein
MLDHCLCGLLRFTSQAASGFFALVKNSKLFLAQQFWAVKRLFQTAKHPA